MVQNLSGKFLGRKWRQKNNSYQWIIRIPIFRLDKDVFPENYDPDISIESKAISEAKRAEKLNAMYTFFDKAIQLNQTVKVRWEAMLKNLEK